MGFVDKVRQKIKEMKDENMYQDALRILQEKHYKLTHNKKKVVHNGEQGYKWVDGQIPPRSFENFYYLKSWDCIKAHIKEYDINSVDLISDFGFKIKFDDIEYTTFRCTPNDNTPYDDIYCIAVNGSILEFRGLPNEVSVVDMPIFEKSFDIHEYSAWVKEFLPNTYLTVRKDTFNTTSTPDVANMLKNTIDKGLIPQYWIWIENEYLCLVGKIKNIAQIKGFTGYEKFDKSSIERYKLDDIVCFLTIGDIRHFQTISGGELTGGGSDIGKAIVGGLLFGAVGAIVNSRDKINMTAFQTEVHKIDERVIRLVINNKFIDFMPDEAVVNIDGKTEKVSTIDAFGKLMPQKDYRILSVKQGKVDKQDDEIEKIKRLSELQEKGIISKEDFEEKKKELLSKI